MHDTFLCLFRKGKACYVAMCFTNLDVVLFFPPPRTHYVPQGTLDIKHQRRSPLVLQMIVLGAVMMCSIYMSFVCLKQTAIYIKPQSMMTEPIERYSSDSRIVGLNQRKIQSNPVLGSAEPIKEHSNDPIIVGMKEMKVQINQELPGTKPSGNSYNPGILDLEQPTTQNQDLTRKEPTEGENSYDPVIVDLLQQKNQGNLEVTRTQPAEEKHPYDSRTVVLEQPVIHEKPKFASTKPIEREHSFDRKTVLLKQADVQTNSEMVSKDPAVQHSHASRLISFKQSKILTKPEPIIIQPIELNSHDHRIVGLKQSEILVKRELTRTNSTDRHPYDPKNTGSNETKIHVKPEFVRTNITQPSCPDSGIPQSEIPYIHYPVPTNYSRRECACTPVRFYVIISMQRSGSKWLESLLNSHINISSNGEIFIEKERRANLSALTSTLDKVYNLDWRHSTNKKACMAAVGFKWMLNQGILKNYEEVYKYFKRRGVLVIFLFRRNLLRRMISLVANRKDHSQVNGTHKAHVNTQQEAEILASYKPKISAKLLVSRLKDATQRAAGAVEHFKSIRHMVLYYEDLVQNNTQKMAQVMEFLRVPQRRLSSSQVKIHTRPLSEMVGNWNAIQRVLKRTQFASFLTSD